MDIKEAIFYLEDSSYGHSKDFTVLKRVLALFNIKEDDFKIIQIAGTNGKGTVGTFLSYFIEGGNKTVGHFSSPHLVDYRERFKVNNKIVEDEFFIGIVEYIKEKIPFELKKELTYFEMSFLISLIIFKKTNVEYIIVETGIGGRFDITNIFKSNELSIITTIGYDHENLLGKTLEEITYHKAGIIKNNSKVISFKHEKNIDNIIIKEAEEKESLLLFLDNSKIHINNIGLYGTDFDYGIRNFHTNMIGEHQVYNIALALEGIKSLGLNIDYEKINSIIANSIFEGRMEKINSNPLIIVDGAHNEEGLKTLNRNVDTLNVKDYILVIGSMNDKNIFSSLNSLIEKSKLVIFTKIDYERAIEPKEIVKLVNLENKEYEIVEDINSINEIVFSNTTKDDIVIFTGSLYLVGEVKKIFKEN